MPPATGPHPARFLFTLTAGRTGTAWLAELLGTNLGIPAIHEPLEIDDFGTRMPDIRLMRSFNERGNDALVRAFWRRKLGAIAQGQRYAETNHTLGKCGLVENLATSGLAAETTLIVLRRERVAQCLSYLARGDFLNITLLWQWYLHPAYANIIVDPRVFLPFGEIGRALWYACECEARQLYYRRHFGDAIRFVEADLETLSTPEGAAALLHALGCEAAPHLPEPRNRGAVPPEPGLAETLHGLIAELGCDAAASLAAYEAAGRSLAAPPQARAA